MSVSPHAAAPLLLPAPPDDLCLAFANTRYWRGSPTPTETLSGLSELLGWAGENAAPAALVTKVAAAAHDPGSAQDAFTSALRLREIIFRTFAAVAKEAAIPPDDLAALNAALAGAPARTQLAERRDGRGWAVDADAPSVEALLAPVLWSAGDLLVGTRAARVRQCANPACGWLFLDDSKSGNRRWCSMSACGNRAKAHRHYLRQKAERAGA